MKLITVFGWGWANLAGGAFVEFSSLDQPTVDVNQAACTIAVGVHPCLSSTRVFAFINMKSELGAPDCGHRRGSLHLETDLLVPEKAEDIKESAASFHGESS
jgi:hypothetical protein